MSHHNGFHPKDVEIQTEASSSQQPHRENRLQSDAAKTKLRNYSVNVEDSTQERVRRTYYEMHTFQTVEYVRSKMEHWSQFDKMSATVGEALLQLNLVEDESDPDLQLPNIVHAYQTAERIREAEPHNTWLQLTGLIHDLGKVMTLYGEPQFSTVGDTFVVGCAPAPSLVYGTDSFRDNPDLTNPKYNTHYGMYSANCGLEQVLMSWGHDEYMYRVLCHNKCTLPEQALYIIRFHSFYPWHTAGDYSHLCSDRDRAMLPWIRHFNQFDLYSKEDDVPNIDELQPYYQGLIDQYCPGLYQW